MMLRIFITIRNEKTCRSWVKAVDGLDLTKEGGWAVQGEFLSHTDGRFEVAGMKGYGHLYEDDTPAPGALYVAAYNGGSWKNSERWAALIVAEPEATDSDSGQVYDHIGVEGGRILFFASDALVQEAIERLRAQGVVFDAALRRKAMNPVFACALAAHAHLHAQEAASLPELPEGWTWGPEISGVRFLRREGHAELLFPTQPFLPADFLRAQAERMRALARVMEAAAEMAERTESHDLAD